MTETWASVGWNAFTRAKRVSEFLRTTVWVLASLAFLGIVALVVAAAKADVDSDAVTYMIVAASSVLFWSMALGALYGLAALLDLQRQSLAMTLVERDPASNENK